jgi:hypothetical protein
MFKYYVWFPDFSKKDRVYKKLEKAINFIAKQKHEVYLNWYLNKNENDTMFGLNIGK